MWLGSHGNDCGSSTILIYAFREREPDVYEAVSGARMHAAYFRPGGVYRDLPDSMPQYKVSKIKNAKALEAAHERSRQGSVLDFLEGFTKRFQTYLGEYHTLLTDSRIWKQRTVGIGVMSPNAEPGPCRADAAWLQHRLGPAQGAAAVRRVATAWTSTSRWAEPATATTATSSAWRR